MADSGALWGGRRRLVSCRCQLRRRRQGTRHWRGVAVWVHALGLGPTSAPAGASAAACRSTVGSSFSLRALQAAVKVAFESVRSSLSSRRRGPCSRVGRVCRAACAGCRRLLAWSRSSGPADMLLQTEQRRGWKYAVITTSWLSRVPASAEPSCSSGESSKFWMGGQQCEGRLDLMQTFPSLVPVLTGFDLPCSRRRSARRRWAAETGRSGCL